MGVSRGLDPSSGMDFDGIKRSLKIVCNKKDLESNVSIAKLLFDFARPQSWTAYDNHHRNPLLFGVQREVPMGIQHYVVDGDRGAFQFVYPRSRELTPDELHICLSLVYYNHVSEDADFGDFDVEMIDLSRPGFVGPRGGWRAEPHRVPRLHRLPKAEIADRAFLNEEADLIYQFLMELAEEPDE
ncbi:hypothetical protein N1037_14765 [Phaeobacter sp. G2]|nr:hypothetical protein N1037_14765 [Phaeobacter sp. G2]